MAANMQVVLVMVAGMLGTACLLSGLYYRAREKNRTSAADKLPLKLIGSCIMILVSAITCFIFSITQQ